MWTMVPIFVKDDGVDTFTLRTPFILAILLGAIVFLNLLLWGSYGLWEFFKVVF